MWDYKVGAIKHIDSLLNGAAARLLSSQWRRFMRSLIRITQLASIFLRARENLLMQRMYLCQAVFHFIRHFLLKFYGSQLGTWTIKSATDNKSVVMYRLVWKMIHIWENGLLTIKP